MSRRIPRRARTVIHDTIVTFGISHQTRILLGVEEAFTVVLGVSPTFCQEVGERTHHVIRKSDRIRRSNPDSEFRWEAIQQVAQEINLKLDPALSIRIDSAGWSMKDGYHPMAPEIGYKPMQALLEKTRDFTAIFCFNDIAAVGAIRALRDSGLSVPGDISVVGFDDILSAAYYTPSLTTVRQPLMEMGKRGAQVLLERIANREAPLPPEIIMAPELVVRESSGPAPAPFKG